MQGRAVMRLSFLVNVRKGVFNANTTDTYHSNTSYSDYAHFSNVFSDMATNNNA